MRREAGGGRRDAGRARGERALAPEAVPPPASRLPHPASWLRTYTALIRAAWLVDLQYRASIAIWMLWGVTEPVIALGIWWSIAGNGSVQGFTRSAFAQYFFAVTLVNQLATAWDAYYLDRWIREGEMNFRLTRPIAPIHEAIADNLAYKARTGSIILVVWLVVAAAWPAVRIPFAPSRWALACIAVVLAASIRFLNGYATGLLAFWTTRATALMELQFGVSLFLSGRIAPLALLPPAVGAVANVLWFPWMLAFPVQVLTGSISTRAELVHGFAMQLVWLAVWWLAYRFVWRRGMRHYGAVGG